MAGLRRQQGRILMQKNNVYFLVQDVAGIQVECLLNCVAVWVS